MNKSDNKDPGIREELKQLGSKLGHNEPHGGFNVPEDFFAHLPNAVQDRISLQSNQPRPAFSFVTEKKLWPVFASVVLLIGLTFSIFLIQMNGVSDFIAEEESNYELEYLIDDPAFGQYLFYESILESDLTAQDILYDMDPDTFDDTDAYNELMEQLFERANYFGINSSYLLSYLD